MLCALILYMNGGAYSLNPTPNDRIFEKHFKAVLFYSQNFRQKNAERRDLRKSSKKYFLSYFILLEMPDLEFESRPLRLISHLQDYVTS